MVEGVDLKSHGAGSLIEKVQETVGGKMERAYAFNQAIVACRTDGTISLPGVFVGGAPVMMGAFVGKGLILRTGQTHVQPYLEPLMRKIEEGAIDPGLLITHTIKLEDGPDMYARRRGDRRPRRERRDLCCYFCP